MNIRNIITVILVTGLPLAAAAQSARPDNSAGDISQRQADFNRARETLSHRVTLRRLQADMAEADARTAEARRRANPEPKEDKKGKKDEDPLANIDAKKLRVKLGLPPTGPLVQEPAKEADDDEKNGDGEQEAQTPPPVVQIDPAQLQMPSLVSITNGKAIFNVGGQQVTVDEGHSINKRYTLKRIDGADAVLASNDGRLSRIGIDWRSRSNIDAGTISPAGPETSGGAQRRRGFPGAKR